MKLKALITQDCKLIIMNNITSVEFVEADEYYGEDRKGLLKEIEYILIAKDISGSEIFLGDYRGQSICEDLIENIAKWVSTKNDMPIYRLWSDYPEFYPLLYDLEEKNKRQVKGEFITMKKFFITLSAFIITAMPFSVTAHAAENLDRDYIEAEIWEDMWNGKGDDGLDFPEASYKHYLLDKWLDENYGSDEYDWSELGELKYEYKDYYREYIDEFDFEDDDNGNWTIETPEHSYRFELFQGMWNMIDENGNTVDTFPPFSTLEDEEDEADTAVGHTIDDNGNGSPRVVGKVTGGTETASEGFSNGEDSDTAESLENGSEGSTNASETNPLPIIAGVAVVAGIGAAGFYIMKKKK